MSAGLGVLEAREIHFQGGLLTFEVTERNTDKSDISACSL